MIVHTDTVRKSIRAVISLALSLPLLALATTPSQAQCFSPGIYWITTSCAYRVNGLCYDYNMNEITCYYFTDGRTMCCPSPHNLGIYNGNWACFGDCVYSGYFWDMTRSQCCVGGTPALGPAEMALAVGGIPTIPMPTPFPPAGIGVGTGETGPDDPSGSPMVLPGTALDGYWGSHTGKFYVARNGVFYRYGVPALSIACAGQGEMHGEQGNWCEGEWYNQSGEPQGSVRGVIYTVEHSAMPYFEAEYNYYSNLDRWSRWGLGRLTDEDAHARGLTSGQTEAR